ncbi:MAG: hypothetical protein JWL84_5090 [Rhodospirillales bacterium]|nr:hypothetical protein [Rhodospirillales bacterium]
MEFSLPPWQLAGRLAMVIGLAVFLGLAFEEVYKSEDRAAPGGIRTFPTLAVTGAMLYLIEPAHALAFVAGILALAVWLTAYLRPAAPDRAPPGMMIPACNLLAYVVGPVALTQPPWVAVALTVTAVLLLGAREWLHGLIYRVPRDELLTAGKFLILVGIILPLVPDQPVASATHLTPYHVWLAVVAICTLSYASYLLQRYVPARQAALLPAILGGAYSSTATTIVLAKRQREAGSARADISAGIVAATSMMYVRLGIVLALFNQRLALALAPALVALFATGAAMAAYEWRRAAEQPTDESLAIPAVNPLQITTAGVFAALFVVISLASSWMRGAFGESGLLVLAAVVGATDIDPFVLNIAQGSVDMPTAVLVAAILIATSSNNVVKAACAIGFGGLAAARRPAAMLLVLAAAGVAAAALYLV